MKLDRWYQYAHKLVGYAYDDPINPPGQRVITGLIRYISPDLSYAMVVPDEGVSDSGTYERVGLLTPGTYEEHDQPQLLFQKPNTKTWFDGTIKIEPRYFLNEEG